MSAVQNSGRCWQDVHFSFQVCTSKDSDNGQPLCATEVDEEGYVVDNAWGDCLEGCPGSSKQIRVLLICTDLYYS